MSKVEENDLEITVKIGGLPISSKICKKDRKEQRAGTSFAISDDLGMEFGNLEDDTSTGEYFRDKIEEANDVGSYQHTIATAGSVVGVSLPQELKEYAVSDVQRILNTYGFNLKEDGIYGINTDIALHNLGVEFVLSDLKQAHARAATSASGDYIAIATAELGVKEWRVGSNPEVDKYHNAVGLNGYHDETPWCGSFVGYVLKEAGYTLGRYPYRALDWLSWGQKAFSPVYGAIAVKKRKGRGSCMFCGRYNE